MLQNLKNFYFYLVFFKFLVLLAKYIVLKNLLLTLFVHLIFNNYFFE